MSNGGSLRIILYHMINKYFDMHETTTLHSTDILINNQNNTLDEAGN